MMIPCRYIIAALWLLFISNTIVIARQQQPGNKHVYDYDICISTKVKILSETMLCNFIEWLEYHYLLGVDQVFIMEDCCEVRERFQEVIEYYKAQGKVTVISASPDESSCKAGSFVMNMFSEDAYMYNNFVRPKCRWNTFIDYDEFITFKDDYFLASKGDGELHSGGSHLNFPMNPYGVLKHYIINETTSRQDAFPLAWFHIGSDGHRERPEGFVTDIYQYGGTEDMFMNAAAGFKSIARTAAFHHWQSPHRPEGMKVSKMALFKTEHMRLPAHCGMKREGSELPTLQLPIHDMYLRHYRFYSLSEFMESRGAFKFSAAGKEVNPCNNMMRLNGNKMNNDPYAYWIHGDTSDCNSVKHSSTAFGEAISTALRRELIGPDKSSIFPHEDLTVKRMNTAFCYKMWGLRESEYSLNATHASPFIYKTYGNPNHHARWVDTISTE